MIHIGRNGEKLFRMFREEPFTQEMEMMQDEWLQRSGPAGGQWSPLKSLILDLRGSEKPLNL